MTGTAGKLAMRLALLGLLIGAAAALVVHFAGFASTATRPVHNNHGDADAIVVLTGGAARIGEAGRLLREGWGKRLLISGVNPRVQREDLERLTGLGDWMLRCCVDVGYAALDTAGNAGETRTWVKAHRFRRLIVVTASYHMPRSMAELANAMPGVELISHAVVPRDLMPATWWRDPASMRILVGEYVKLISAMTRLRVQGWIAAGRGTVVTDQIETPGMANHR